MTEYFKDKEACDACRILFSQYNARKTALRNMTAIQSGAEEAWKQRKRLLRNELEISECMLKRIRQRYGEIAEEIIREIYINHNKQDFVAKSYGYSLRTLQRRCSQWICCASEVYYERGR